MNVIRHPYLNALITAAMSFFYAAVFLLTSGHLEFKQTLQAREHSESQLLEQLVGFFEGGRSEIYRLCVSFYGRMRSRFIHSPENRLRRIPDQNSGRQFARERFSDAAFVPRCASAHSERPQLCNRNHCVFGRRPLVCIFARQSHLYNKMVYGISA